MAASFGGKRNRFCGGCGSDSAPDETSGDGDGDLDDCGEGRLEVEAEARAGIGVGVELPEAAGGGGGGGGAFFSLRGTSGGAATEAELFTALSPASCLRWNLLGTGGSSPTSGPPSWAM